MIQPETDKFIEHFFRVFHDQDGWELSYEKRGVNVYQKYDETSFTILKGVGTVKASLNEVRETIANPEKRAIWDLFYESGKILNWIEAEKICIVHICSKSQNWMVWPRDACLCIIQTEHEGGYLIVGKSIEDKELCPEVEGYVRGKVLISGFYVQPLPLNEGVLITYIFQVDAGGWLPYNIVNLVNTYQPLSILGIRKMLTGTTT